MYDRGGFRGGRGGGRGGFRGGGGGFRGGFQGNSKPVTEETQINIRANRYKITPQASLRICKHRVHITNTSNQREHPDPERRKELLFEALKAHLCELEKPDKLPPQIAFCYDWDHILLAPRALNIDRKVGRSREMRVEVEFEGSIDLKDIFSETRGKDNNAFVVDMIMQRAAEVSNKRLAPRRFVPHDMSLPEHHLEISPDKAIVFGHIQSVCSYVSPKQTPLTTAIIVNAAGTLYFKPDSLIGWLQNACRVRNLDCENFVGDVGFTNRCLRGLKIETSHLGYSRIYTAHGLCRASALTQTIDGPVAGYKRTEKLTVASYFKGRYGISLQFPNYVLLQVKPERKKSYLPLEVVKVPAQPVRRRADEATRATMCDAMSQAPLEKAKYINDKAAHIFANNAVLDFFGLEVDSNMAECEATVLVPPTLEYKDKKTVIPVRGEWRTPNFQFFQPSTPDKLQVLNLTQAGKTPMIKNFLIELLRMAESLGVRIPMPSMPDLIHPEKLLEELPEYAKDLRSLRPRLVLVVLPERSKELLVYRRVKEHLDSVCPTQCVAEKNVKMCKPALLRNLLLKINQKLGGTNQILANNLEKHTIKHLWTRLQGASPVFVLSADVSRPPPSANERGSSAPAVSALVGTCNRYCATYGHAVRVQTRDSEEVVDLSTMLRSVARQQCGDDPWPPKVVYIRNGVSEGQFDTVMGQEIAAIRETYRSEDWPEPKVTGIIVQKKHQTRFFRTEVNNPADLEPGTLLIDDLNHPRYPKNFYLLSHAGIKGTSRPCRYFVIHDEVGQIDGTPLKFWAIFCYQLCHLYGRCQRAVSIPAPAYYAQLLAERGRLCLASFARQVLGIQIVDDASSVHSGFSSNTTMDLTTEEKREARDLLNKKASAIDRCEAMFYL